MAVVGIDSSSSSSSVSEEDSAEHAERAVVAGAVAAAIAGVSRAIVVGAFRVVPGMVWMAAAADAIVTGSVGTRLCVSSLSSRPRPHRGPIVVVKTVCLLPRFLSLAKLSLSTVLYSIPRTHPPTRQPDPTHIYQPHSDVDDETNRPVTTTKMMTTTNTDLHLHLKEKVRRPSVNKEFIKSGHFEVLY